VPNDLVLVLVPVLYLALALVDVLVPTALVPILVLFPALAFFLDLVLAQLR